MSRDINQMKSDIISGKTMLGIEFGSTRIKAVLMDDENEIAAQGTHDWENRYENGVWTYHVDDVIEGLRDTYASLAADVKEKYGVELEQIGAIGISAMMHGYMALNQEGDLLVPFRTWRNTITQEASEKLTELFQYNIPQRWSIAHLYQAVLKGESHLPEISYLTTLSGYVHWLLTGEKVLGVGDASGMFPIDINTKDYDEGMVEKFDQLTAPNGYPWKLRGILPKVLLAGDEAGCLTEEGAKLLDVSGS